MVEKSQIPAAEAENRKFSAMQVGNPFKVYCKTILGKVHVIALNPFTGEPEGIILQGNTNDSSLVDQWSISIWDEKADAFFKRLNKRHFDAGRLTELTRAIEIIQSPNVISDEEIDAVLNSKFLVLKNKLDSFTEEAPIFRLLNRARELEKSEKIIKHIEGKLAELQLKNYEPGE